VRSVKLGPYNSSDRELVRLLFNDRVSATGVNVSTRSASGLSATWACVNLIAATIAGLPFLLYRRQPDGTRERYTKHPTYAVLHSRPNPEQDAFGFWELMTTAILLRGNGYAEIVRDQVGRVSELWYIHPDRVRVERARDGAGGLIYPVANGTRPEVVLTDRQMLHVCGPMSEDGITGQSPIAVAREVFGSALALERFGAEFYAHGAAAGGVLSHPGTMSPEARERFKAELEKKYSGVERAHRMLVLEQGMKFEKVTVSPEDAQFIEGRRFSVEEEARIWGVPVHMIGGSRTGMTYSNSETEALSFLKFTLGPWLSRIAAAVNRACITPAERETVYAEHLPDALLQTDTAGRFAAYQVGLDAGFLTIDEVRRKENLPPLPAAAAPAEPVNPGARAVVADAVFRVLSRWTAELLRASASSTDAAVKVHRAYERLERDTTVDQAVVRMLTPSMALLGDPTTAEARAAKLAAEIRRELLTRLRSVVTSGTVPDMPARVTNVVDKEMARTYVPQLVDQLVPVTSPARTPMLPAPSAPAGAPGVILRAENVSLNPDTVQMIAPPMFKRIIRNANGDIEAVIESPLAADGTPGEPLRTLRVMRDRAESLDHAEED
jgi:HK97 family phage portal protein